MLHISLAVAERVRIVAKCRRGRVLEWLHHGSSCSAGAAWYGTPAAAKARRQLLFCKDAGSLMFLAGVISQEVNGVITGTAGADGTVEDAYIGARSCARTHFGSLAKVKSIVSVNGYVNGVPEFAESLKAINGASDLLMAVFGEAGRHVRAAIGVNGLPRNALVELQMVVGVEA
ncbi:RidA family protein [Alloacidobacterium dinghuense]|uniref:RidA family protein n=1 Tax=Alloacidobacterium dinghuense TaxID=2763107 RepID=UPI001C939955|nr:RidA family protein [Alloacidobacterium dinghuense]